MAESHPLLRQAMAIIEAIPDESVNLNDWSNVRENIEADCGTIACAGGWLAIKGFSGLRLDPLGYPANNMGDGPITSIGAALQLSFCDTEDLFGTRCSPAEYDPTASHGMTDKDFFLERCRNFLARA